MDPRLKRIRALIVDDDPQFLKTAAWFLSTEPQYNVVATASSIADMQVVVEQQQLELILIDVQLVLASGTEFESYIKTLAPLPKILLLSIFDAEHCRQRAHFYGADDCVAKVRFADEIGRMTEVLFPS